MPKALARLRWVTNTLGQKEDKEEMECTVNLHADGVVFDFNR